MKQEDPVASTCSHCGGQEFYGWDVDAGGGWSPKLLPLPMFDGAKCTLRCCLSCGRIDWFATPDALISLREMKARG